MARIRIADEVTVSGYADAIWFEQVEPTTLSEKEFEDRVVLHAPSVYPDYFVLPFKRTLETEYGPVSPDLVFLAKNYSEWCIVEIELGTHSLTAHVEPQTQKLASVSLKRVDAEYLHSMEQTLDVERVLHLFSTVPQKVMIILNEPKPLWTNTLKRLGATIAVFELFQSENYREIFRVNGEYPSQIITSVTTCSTHPYLSRWLIVDDPIAISLERGQKIRLRYNSCVTYWERYDANSNVMLKPVGKFEINPDKTYEILRQIDNSLVLRQS